MTTNVFVGIDPGSSGGIAALDANGRVMVAQAMPDTDADVLALMRETLKFMATPFACIERVSASPQMGVVSAFKFGRGLGGLMMALQALGIPHDAVLPTKWQTLLGCRTGGGRMGERDHTAAKNLTKARAQQLWPEYPRITHAIADALLIAEFCRRVHCPMKEAINA